MKCLKWINKNSLICRKKMHSNRFPSMTTNSKISKTIFITNMLNNNEWLDKLNYLMTNLKIFCKIFKPLNK